MAAATLSSLECEPRAWIAWWSHEGPEPVIYCGATEAEAFGRARAGRERAEREAWRRGARQGIAAAAARYAALAPGGTL